MLFIRDLPPVSTINIQITQPSIYFGELSNEYVIARTRAREFHYPKGEDNVYADYDGHGGVAARRRSGASCSSPRTSASYQILLSDDITTESRLMFDRQIRARVDQDRAVPHLDDDPYPVIDDGRIFWIQDAYTTSSRYPYSTRGRARRQLHPQRGQDRHRRLSRHGHLLPRRAERSDRPDAREDLSDAAPAAGEMPSGLRRHVRYPEGIFNLQAAVSTRRTT